MAGGRVLGRTDVCPEISPVFLSELIFKIKHAERNIQADAWSQGPERTRIILFRALLKRPSSCDEADEEKGTRDN